jgi:hypothetical protein
MQKTTVGGSNVLKDVRVYECIAVLDSVGVKVIAKEVAAGEEHLCNPRKHDRSLIEAQQVRTAESPDLDIAVPLRPRWNCPD